MIGKRKVTAAAVNRPEAIAEIREAETLEVRLADVKLVLYTAVENAHSAGHLFGRLLKATGRDRSRRQAVKHILHAYMEADQAFADRATPVTWAQLVVATRKLSTLIKTTRELSKAPAPSVQPET